MVDDARLTRAREALSAAVAQAIGTGATPGSGPLRVEPEYAEAKRVVLRKLAAAPRSRAQLAQALAAKDISESTANEVLDRMEEVGLVDDEAFAQMVVRSVQDARGLAKRSVEEELRRRGVDDETAADAVEHIDDDRDRGAARELVAKKIRTMRGLEVEVQRRRLAGYLARRGYPAGIAFPVINEALDAGMGHPRD